MKRILAMVVCVAILATVAITGSVAYFTDTDSATNVFTVGNVVIEQYEQKRVGDELKDLTSNDNGQHELGMLHPMVEKSEGGSTVEWPFNKTTTDSTNINLRDLTHWANYVDKIVTVENKGKSDAYVRNIVAIPTGDADVKWLDVDWYDAKDKSNSDWKAPSVEDGTIIKGVDIGGVTYNIYVIYYGSDGNGELAPKETTLPTLLGVGLSKNVDYDKTTQKYYYYDKNDKTTSTPTDLNIDPEHMYIYVATQAVQTEGFDTAEEAFDATFGAIDQNNGPWADLGQSYAYDKNGKRYSLPELTAPDENGNSLVSVSTDGKTLTKISTELTELYISGNDVETIGSWIARSNDTTQYKLEKVIIGKGVKAINNLAFDDTTSLKTVEFPSTPITIGYGAFENCTSLAEVTIPGTATLLNSETHTNGAQFSGCTNLKIVNIGEGVKVIPYNCFYGCTNLTSVSLPSTLETIEKNAFKSCYALSSITIPENVSEIGEYAFDTCKLLTSITIPSKITTINEGTFDWCFALKNVTIENSTGNITIGKYAFRKTALEKLTIKGSKEGRLTIDANAFDDTSTSFTKDKITDDN